jgi:hypothetical protein
MRRPRPRSSARSGASALPSPPASHAPLPPARSVGLGQPVDTSHKARLSAAVHTIHAPSGIVTRAHGHEPGAMISSGGEWAGAGSRRYEELISMGQDELNAKLEALRQNHMLLQASQCPVLP